MAVARRGFVTLDCADPGPLAEFWATILGGEVMFTTATTVGVRTDWTWIAATAVAGYQPPTWPEAGVPKQIHLDLAVSDLDAAVAEAERLGAVPAAFQPAPGQRRILFDPAGHPFCLTREVLGSSGLGLRQDVRQCGGQLPGIQ